MLICALKVRVDHTATEKEGFPFKHTSHYSIIFTLALAINNRNTQNYELADAYLIGFDMPNGVQHVYVLLPREE